MKTMEISFFFTEKGCKKGKLLIFHVFLNNDISITVADIVLKLCMSVLHISPEEGMSQIFYLGFSFYFM